MPYRLLAALGLATIIATPVTAHDYKAGDLSIAHPWTRQTAPGQSVGGGFLSIGNSSDRADRLVSASSPAARKVEIHEMKMDGDIMRMREIKGGLSIPAKSQITLKPGSYHLMLTGLKAPLERGQMVPVTLRFERAGSVDVQLKVEPVSYGSGGGHDHH